jgi:hypothetical protein
LATELDTGLIELTQQQERRSVNFTTSQWSLAASRGRPVRRHQPGSGLAKATAAQLSGRVEEMCRALVAFTTPDGRPVLCRPLSCGERKRLSQRAAELTALLAPHRRALERIEALLKAAVSGDLASARDRISAETVFGNRPPPPNGAPAIAPKITKD